jgi:hypothetical protein
MSNAIEMLKNNDTGLLRPDQIEDFRAYLVDTGCKVRKGNNHGQLLFVGTSAGWAPLQKGANDTVKTPYALRSVINDFLKTPMARSLSLHKRISQSKSIPLNADLARVVAAAVTAKPAAIPFGLHVPCDDEAEAPTVSDRRVSEPQTCAVVEPEHSAVHAHSIGPQCSTPDLPANFHILPAGANLVSGEGQNNQERSHGKTRLYSPAVAMCTLAGEMPRRTHNYRVKLIVEPIFDTGIGEVGVGMRNMSFDSTTGIAQFEQTIHGRTPNGDLANLIEGFAKLAAQYPTEDVDSSVIRAQLLRLGRQARLMLTAANTDAPPAPAPAAEPVHLEDLRDDFAIHCPLTPLEDESPAAFADRRWAYADLMMQKRSPQYAD